MDLFEFKIYPPSFETYWKNIDLLNMMAFGSAIPVIISSG